MSGEGLAFVDTNILVYAFEKPDSPRKETAKALILELMRSDRLRLWDALIVASAVRSGASILLTEDLNHGQVISGVRVENPFR
jgi:predicted nucleic acid-binding protein